MLIDASVRDLLAAFASATPTPGGGSASALASAVGASLLAMVAGLPKTRAGSEDNRTALAQAAAALTGIRRELSDAIDADAAAYDRVVAAYKLPKSTAEEKAARKAAIQQALRGAIDVPLRVVRLSEQAIEAASTVAEHSHRGASSDVGVAIALLRAGLNGARLNVDINLDSLDDEMFKAQVSQDLEAVVGAARATADAAEQALARA